MTNNPDEITKTFYDPEEMNLYIKALDICSATRNELAKLCLDSYWDKTTKNIEDSILQITDIMDDISFEIEKLEELEE